MSTETTYLLASQCHPNAFAEVIDFPKRGIFHLSTPTTQKVFPDEELYVGGGGTIGLTALGLAVALGYRRVYLLGFDSSYSGKDSHAAYQEQNKDDEVIDVWVEDRKYMATRAMAAQTMDFFPFYSAIRKEFPDFEVNFIGNGLFYDFIRTNNNPSTRERELSKYALAYLEDDYGMTQERKDGLDNLLQNLPVRGSYLDVSTGRGETLALAEKHGFARIQGTETVEGLLTTRVARAILPNLPFKGKEFEVVSLIEVIEHLVPEDVEPALIELERVASKHILISAGVTDCWVGGVNLHPSARPVEQWEELFSRLWGSRVYRVGNLGSSPAWRVDL